MQMKPGCLVCVVLAATSLTACDRSTEASSPAALAPASLVPSAQPTKLQTAQRSTPSSPSGTRLRSMYFRGDDGSRVHYGFFDAERKEHCSFAYSSGGNGQPQEYRCFPNTGGSRPCDEPATYFQDSLCTKPLYRVGRLGPQQEPGKYYRVTEATSGKRCEGQPKQRGIYVLNLVKPSVLYQKNGFDQSCIEFSVGFEDDRFASLGEMIPEDRFVRAVLTTDMP